MAFIAAKIPGLDMSDPKRQSLILGSNEDLKYHQKYVDGFGNNYKNQVNSL